MRNRLFRVGGAMIAFISLITLPDDIDTWGDRLQDIGGMFKGNPVAGVALAFGIILIVWGYRDELRRRLSGSRWRSDKELEDELSTWLRDSGFSLQYKPNLPDVSFTFTATSLGRPVTVVRLVNASGVHLQTLVKPSPPHEAVIAAMDDDQSSSLTEELGIELARFGLGFSLVDILGQGIVLDYPILVSDTITQYQFVDRVNFVARAILLVQMIVTKHVRQEQQRQGKTSAQLIPVPQSSPDTADSPIAPTS
jgi:hypothetical protein